MCSWNKQMYAVRVWHELTYETDPNLTNLLITKDWELWIIDFTRAFRLFREHTLSHFRQTTSGSGFAGITNWERR